MRWLLIFFRRLLGAPDSHPKRPQLMSIYFNENNRRGRRKENRDRA